MNDPISDQWQPALFKSQIGGLYVGVNFQAITFGLASLVILTYFTQPRKPDARWIRSLIVALWVLCAFCACINFYSTYYFLVLTISIPKASIWAPWSLSLLIAIVASVSTVVRLLLLHRLQKFHRRKGDLSYSLAFVIALIALLSLVGVAGGFGITVRLLLPTDSSTAKLKALFDALLVCAIAADVLFVVVQGYSLHRSRSGFRRTDSVINILILYTISTGLIPTAFAFATLVSMFLASARLTYAVLYMQVGNLYLITLVASLNHRDSVLKRMAPPMELNYSVFGRLPHSDGDAEPLPAAHGGGIRFPRLCYGHAPRTGGFTTRTVHDKAGAEEDVSEEPSSRACFTRGYSGVGDKHCTLVPLQGLDRADVGPDVDIIHLERLDHDPPGG